MAYSAQPTMNPIYSMHQSQVQPLIRPTSYNLKRPINSLFSIPVDNAVGTIEVASDGDAGKFLCNYLAYHLGWYQEWSQTQKFPKCKMAGFVHVADDVTPAEAAAAVKAQLDAVITALKE